MPSRARRLVVLWTVLLTTLAAGPAFASPAETDPQQGANTTTPAGQPIAPGVRRDRVLPSQMRGRSALQALGENLQGVAARNDLSPTGLKRLLTEDHTAWLSVEGQVFFTEETPEEVSGGASGANPSANLAPAHATSQTFALHSNTSAARTLFLDFDGATIEGTKWNTSNGGKIADGNHAGWDSDGAPSTFSSSEHAWIQEVWREVAESYAPMNVDVTTQDPGQAAWTRTSSSDTKYGTRVVITSSKTAQTQACGGCLGIAWLGTFDMVDSVAAYQPAWVFATNRNFAPMIVAQAAAHEAGHNLGLSHDGLGGDSYYGGTQAWGPIMGSSQTRAISQFSKGEYSGANQTEDDFAVMQANGLPLRADDHGSTTGTASQLGALPSYAANGIISTRTDLDLFAISLPCTTDLTAKATGIGAQTTLDLSLTVLDGTGRTVASNSPASTFSGSPPVSNGMDAGVTVRAATGTYYLRVDGVGNGAPTTGGWSDYGSLGQFRVTANGCSDAAGTTPDPGTTSDPGTTPPPSPAPTPKPATAQPVTRPTAPVIRVATSGARRGPVTAIARWAAPTRTGGAAVTKYRVRALRLNKQNRVVRAYGSAYLSAGTRALTMRLPKARYTFSVMAWNRAGASPWSRSSGIVRAR